MSKLKRHPITGCAPSLIFGQWYVEPLAFQSVVEQVKQIDLVWLAEQNKQAESKEPPPLWELVGDGVGVMHVEGTITKKPTSFSSVLNCSSMVNMVQALGEMRDDGRVKVAVMHFESSPGGQVGGAAEVVAAMKKFMSVKTLVSHADDMCASLAYFFACQCQHVSSNWTAMVGSIGTMMVLRDTSGAFAAEKIEIIPVTTGKYKAAFMPGVKVTPEQRQYAQEIVDKTNQPFLDAVRTGRKFSEKKMSEIAADAKVYVAQDAKNLGLTDRICSLEEAVEAAQTFRPVVPGRGPQPALPLQTAPTRRIAMPLSAQQLDTARKLPGAAGITEENADLTLLQVATEQSAKASSLLEKKTLLDNEVADLRNQTRAPDARVSKGLAQIAVGKLDLMLEKGSILPAQANILKPAFLGDGGTVPNPVLLQEMSGGKLVYEPFFEALSQNTPNGVLNPVSGGQPAPRDIPGTDPNVKKEVRPTLERVNHLRTQQGLAPITRQEYEG